MKALIYIFVIFMMTYCSKPHQNSLDNQPTLDKDTERVQTSSSEKTISKADYDKPDSSHADYYCSTEILLKTEQSLDDLDLELIADFLATFNESCKNNVEYSEWSNELLFKVLTKRPDSFLELMTNNSSLSRDYILGNIENPVNDLIHLNKTINGIEKLDTPDSKSWKLKIINSLKIAQEKY